jgi:hypothetical protein
MSERWMLAAVNRRCAHSFAACKQADRDAGAAAAADAEHTTVVWPSAEQLSSLFAACRQAYRDAGVAVACRQAAPGPLRLHRNRGRGTRTCGTRTAHAGASKAGAAARRKVAAHAGQQQVGLVLVVVEAARSAVAAVHSHHKQDPCTAFESMP